MQIAEIRATIKDTISNVANIAPEDIADNAHFIDDLQLDSLSLLEIGVDIDYAFKLGVPEERLQELRTVQETVDLVLTTKGQSVESAA
ncbi:MAG: acyl carrier protein [Acidobacteriota bacterium]